MQMQNLTQRFGGSAADSALPMVQQNQHISAEKVATFIFGGKINRLTTRP
jgi:hypothetical protein